MNGGGERGSSCACTYVELERRRCAPLKFRSPLSLFSHRLLLLRRCLRRSSSRKALKTGRNRATRLPTCNFSTKSAWTRAWLNTLGLLVAPCLCVTTFHCYFFNRRVSPKGRVERQNRSQRRSASTSEHTPPLKYIHT